MEQLKRIDCWIIDEKVNETPQLTIYKVHHEQKSDSKYYLGVMNSVNSISKEMDEYYFPFNICCQPEFTYYNSHCCFPIIPTSNSSGYLDGQFYFVFEKVNRSLSSILSDNSLDISVNDLGTIACQILEILQYCFSKNKVVKNLGVNDFYLRRTTKGYRVIFLNQDFYSKESYFIEDPTFTSLSVMNGNEPTPLDNLISVSYIMYYLATGSLPWIGLTDKAMKESKKNSASFDYPSPLQCFSTLHSSNHIDPTQFIEQSIQTISQAVTKMGITFGKSVHSFKKKKKVDSPILPPQPAVTPKQTPPSSPCRVVMVSGQKYEVKVIDGKRVMEPINSPLPPFRLRKRGFEPKNTETVIPVTVTEEVNKIFEDQVPKGPVEKRQLSIDPHSNEKNETVVETPRSCEKSDSEKEVRFVEKRQRVVIKHTSASSNLQHILTSSVFSDILIVAAAAIIGS